MTTIEKALDLQNRVNELLIELPDNDSRLEFLSGINACCKLCGDLIIDGEPCYCGPGWDE